MSRRQRHDCRGLIGEPMGGYVVCDCGSKSVWAHDQRNAKGRLVGVVYHCVACGNRALVGRRA